MSTGREEQEAAKKKKSLTQATLAFGSLQLAHGQPTVLSAPANQVVVAPLVGLGIGLRIGRTGSWNWLMAKATPICSPWVLQLAGYGKHAEKGWNYANGENTDPPRP